MMKITNCFLFILLFVCCLGVFTYTFATLNVQPETKSPINHSAGFLIRQDICLRTQTDSVQRFLFCFDNKTKSRRRQTIRLLPSIIIHGQIYLPVPLKFCVEKIRAFRVNFHNTKFAITSDTQNVAIPIQSSISPYLCSNLLSLFMLCSVSVLKENTFSLLAFFSYSRQLLGDLPSCLLYGISGHSA